MNVSDVPLESRLALSIAKLKPKVLTMQKKLRLAVRCENEFMSMTPSTLIDWRNFRVGQEETALNKAMHSLEQRFSANQNAQIQAQKKAARKEQEQRLRLQFAAQQRAKSQLQSDYAAARLAEEKRRKEMEAIRRKQYEEFQKKLSERKAAAAKLKKFMLSLTEAYKEMRQRIRRSSRKPKNEFVLRWHEKEERKIRKNQELRIKALKSSDHEAYVRMVQESKNERLQMLLGKTNDIMEQLGQKLQEQKNDVDKKDDEMHVNSDSNVDQSRRHESRETNTKTDSVKHKDLLSGTKNFNRAAISFEEEVVEQPRMLQNVSLRNYQLAGLKWMASLYVSNMNGILADEMVRGHENLQTDKVNVHLFFSCSSAIIFTIWPISTSLLSTTKIELLYFILFRCI